MVSIRPSQSDEALAAIEGAFVTHGIVVFCGQTLPEAMKQRIARLKAVHRYGDRLMRRTTVEGSAPI